MLKGGVGQADGGMVGMLEGEAGHTSIPLAGSCKLNVDLEGPSTEPTTLVLEYDTRAIRPFDILGITVVSHMLVLVSGYPLRSMRIVAVTKSARNVGHRNRQQSGIIKSRKSNRH